MMQGADTSFHRQKSRCRDAQPRWPYSGRGHRDPQPESPAVRTVGLQVRYPGAVNPSINNVSLEISCGQRVAIVGPNGAGKSTLLKAMAGLLKQQAGAIRLFGNPT